MKNSRTRLMAISGATLALIVAGTAVVSAAPGNRGDRHGGFGGGKARAGADFQRGGFGGGLRGEFRQRLGGQIDSFVRRETTLDQGEDGILIHRVDNGTVASATEGGLDYTLATGETVSVTIDEETQAVAFVEPDQAEQSPGRRGFRGPRLIPNEVAVADIEAGTEVAVWAQSQEDGSFLAQRVVVQPMLDESIDEAAAADGDAATSTTTDA